MEMLAEVSEKEVRKPEDEDKASGPKYACKHCAKVFTRPSSLRIHTYSRESSYLNAGADEQIPAKDHMRVRPQGATDDFQSDQI